MRVRRWLIRAKTVRSAKLVPAQLAAARVHRVLPYGVQLVAPWSGIWRNAQILSLAMGLF